MVALVALVLAFSQRAGAQNTSPYWSAAGNSNATTTSKLGTTNSVSLNLVTNNATRMRIGSNGNIGVNTTNPLQKLDVNGNINLAKGFGLYVENHRVIALDSFKGTVFLGNSAGAQNTAPYNTAIGYHTFGYNTIGYYNAATGTFALYANTTGRENVATGAFTLISNTTGSHNTAHGTYSLYNNTTGEKNTASGFGALYYNTLGSNNAAMGSEALYNNFNGSYNTATGHQALYANSSGNKNVAAGGFALYWNTTAESNTGVGYEAMFSNSTGRENAALGYRAMYGNAKGDFNTAVGACALEATTGSTVGNTAVGYQAGADKVNGGNNTFIGALASAAGDNVQFSTALGVSARVSASDQVRIGGLTIVSIGGYANWTQVSDGRVKRNIRENVPGLSFINKLKPVTYNLNLDAADEIMGIAASEKKRAELLPEQYRQRELAARRAKQSVVCTGFVAQDVEKAAKELGYDFSGVDAAKNDKDLYGLRYAEFVVPLVKAVQELSKENNELKSRLEKLESLLNKKGLPENNCQPSKAPSTNDDVFLQQNTPNPANGLTRIMYTTPKTANHALLIVTDNTGNIVRTVTLAKSGVAEINTAGLSSGTYHYSLVADGTITQTKQLEVIR